MFVANVSDQEVFSDQIVVEHIPQLIVQENHYYPFGLELSGLNKRNKPEYRWKFQGQEEQKEFGLNWSSFKWRNADVALGRFFSVDPLAEDYVYNSTYAFSENKVISHVELEGLESIAAMNKPDNRPLMLQTIPNSSKTQSNAIKRQVVNSEGRGITRSSFGGGAPINAYNSTLRLWYNHQISKLKPLYSPYDVTPDHIKGANQRASKLDATRNKMIGPRKHLDKIKGVEPRYTSNKVNLVKGYYGPITEKAPNPRFFRSNRALTNVSKLSLVGSAVQIYDTGTNLIQANDEGRLGEQTVIEGSKFAGARLGLTVGVEISMKIPTKHPLVILGIVGVTTAIGSAVGENRMRALIEEAKKGSANPGTMKDAHSPKR